MRQKTSEFFEVKFSYEKEQENGSAKIVTELYVVEAMSFTEAEATIIKEMESYISGDYKIKAIAIPPYSEIWFSDKNTDDKFYVAKLQFITVDEKTQKEKKTNAYYLVQGGNFDIARKYVEDAKSGTMIDYKIVSIKETPVMDVFEHKA